MISLFDWVIGRVKHIYKNICYFTKHFYERYYKGNLINIFLENFDNTITIFIQLFIKINNFILIMSLILFRFLTFKVKNKLALFILTVFLTSQIIFVLPNSNKILSYYIKLIFKDFFCSPKTFIRFVFNNNRTFLFPLVCSITHS